MAIDGEAMTIDEAPSETPPQHAHDFSNVQGLQVVGAHPGAGDDPASDAWREALKLELEARAARFHQSVDASLVLSDDGVIRWLGDPVARLAAGPDLLTPRALILADASLPDGARAHRRSPARAVAGRDGQAPSRATAGAPEPAGGV